MAGLATDAVLIGALAVLATSVALRSRSGGHWEILLSDVAIALVPVLVWMALTGRLKELKLGGEGFSAVFQQATGAKVSPPSQHSPSPIWSPARRVACRS